MTAYHYTLCGLDNVYLENGYVVRDTRHGKAVAVNDVDGLHKLLASTLVEKPAPLTGKEFRFLRVQLGLTQDSLANLMGVTEGAVSLWERKDVVPRANDQLIRMMVMAKLDGNARVRMALERIQTVQKLVHQKYVVRESNHKREIVVESVPDAAPTHDAGVTAVLN